MKPRLREYLGDMVFRLLFIGGFVAAVWLVRRLTFGN